MRSKQKLFAGLASLTLFDIAAASAADMPVKAPVRTVEPAAIYSWGGAYIGAHAGYRWADAHFTGEEDFGPPVFDKHLRPDGGIVGVHLGYNVMLSSTVLAGLEADWTWGSKRDHYASASNDGLRLYSNEVDLTWQATIRGRLGVVSGPWLFYATGGVAFIRTGWKETISGAFNGILSESETRTGWTVGGGIERMSSSAWLIRLEYLYEDFGRFDVPHGFVLADDGRLDLTAHKVRVGISYKFGGPVVARY